MPPTDPPPSSYEMESIIGRAFRAFEEIFSSHSIQVPSALHALRLATRHSGFGVCNASYQLFKTIMALDNLTDQHWEATRLALYAAFRDNECTADPGEPKEILKFIDYHVGLQGAKEVHESYISYAMASLVRIGSPDPLTFQCFRDFNWTSPSFVRGVCSMVHPCRPTELRGDTTTLISLLSDSWFSCSVLTTELEEMPNFSEHIAEFMDGIVHEPSVKIEIVTILFGMLRSPEWRNHIATGFWRALAYCAQVRDTESAIWCLQNAIELLEFTRALPDGEGLKWWYGTLWLRYDKLDTTVRDEVKRIAADMLGGDGLSDLNLYLSLMQEEVMRIRQELNELSYDDRQWVPGWNMQARLTAMEGNYDQLARITGKR